MCNLLVFRLLCFMLCYYLLSCICFIIDVISNGYYIFYFFYSNIIINITITIVIIIIIINITIAIIF